MLFLIEYDRSHGRLVKFVTFDDAERARAEDARIELEVDLNSQGIEHEVVLLEASSEEGLRRTHRRYFEDLRSLIEAPAT
jgi:hypothetical protein